MIKEIVWIRNLLAELGLPLTSPTPIGIDNARALQVTENDGGLLRTMKHIELRYHYARLMVQAGVVRPHHIPSASKEADLLTKATSVATTARHRSVLVAPAPPPASVEEGC